MHIERHSLSELKPAPYNPRVRLKPGDAAWQKLERSLQEFELVQPIVWNRRTGHVVGGHQRLEVLRHQGVTHVECAVVDLPLDREKALNVALNNARVGSDWDPDKLLALLTDLQEVPDFDATLTGFDEQDLRDLLLDPVAPSEQQETTSDAQSTMRLELEFPGDDWPELEQDLNSLLAVFPQLRLHVLS